MSKYFLTLLIFLSSGSACTRQQEAREGTVLFDKTMVNSTNKEPSQIISKESLSSQDSLAAPVPGAEGVLQVQSIDASSVRISWVAATSSIATDSLLYSLYWRKPETSNYNNLTAIEASDNLFKDKPTTEFVLKNLRSEQSFEINVLVKDASGRSSVYHPLQYTVPALVRSLDFTKELIIGQDLDFTLQDFSERFVAPQARPLAAIRLVSLPKNAQIKVAGQAVTLGESIDASNLDRMSLYFVSGSLWGDVSFEWQGSDGSSWSRSPGQVTARRLLSSISGIGQSKRVRGNPFAGEVTTTRYTDWPAGFVTDIGLGFQGGTWDGHHFWLMPRNHRMLVKIDTRNGAMQGFTNYPSGFQLGAGMATAIFDGESIWGLPLGANGILKINKDTNAMTMINNYPSGYTGSSTTLMHCGIYDGRKIWAAPWIANSVLSLDTSSKAMSISPINGCGTSTVGCGRCLYDGRFMYSSSTNGVHKVDLQTGAMETVSTSINGGIPMHDGSYLWSLESNPGLHVRRTQMKTGDSIMYPDWAGAGETPNLNAGGCGLYDGRHYWINLDQKIIQFDTQTGQKIASYTLAGPVSTQSQRNMLSCAFDGENIWLAATAGTEVYKLSSARPSTSPTELLIPEGHVQFLGKEVFAGAFHDAAQKTMARISIRQLPQHGQLKLGKTVVQEGAVIAAEQLSELNYQAQADYRGPDQFLFRAAHASESSTVDETFKLRIGQLRSSDGFGESGLIPRGIALPETVIARGFKLGLERPSLGEQNFAGASFDGNDLWLLPRDADQVLRVERSSGKTSSFSEWPSGLKHSAGAFLGGVFDGRRLWLIPDKAEQLVRIERETGVMQSFSQWPEGFTKQAGSFAGGVFDGQRIWLIPAHANRLISIDPVTGKMGSESVWPLGFDGNEASKFDGGLYDGQSIWLIPSSAKSLIRVDHDTGIMRAYNNWPQGFAAQSLAKFRGGTFDGHRLWLAPRQAKVLLAVDRDTGEMTSYGEWPAGLNLGPDAFAGAVYDGNSVWLIPHDASHLVRINTESGAMSLGPAWPKGFSKTSSSFFGGLFDGEFLWLVPSTAEQLLRLGTR